MSCRNGRMFQAIKGEIIEEASTKGVEAVNKTDRGG